MSNAESISNLTENRDSSLFVPSLHGAEDRFLSLASFRAAHSEMLKLHRESGNDPEVLTKIEQLISKGQATGVLLDNEDDRWAAQSLLDYWNSLLYRAGHEAPDATLVDFDRDLSTDTSKKIEPLINDAMMENLQAILKAIPKIRQLREKAGITQLELSQIVGVTETSIQNWERGRAGVEQIEMVIKLCQALQCEPEQLIEYVEIQPSETLIEGSGLAQQTKETANPSIATAEILEDTIRKIEPSSTLIKGRNLGQAKIVNIIKE